MRLDLSRLAQAIRFDVFAGFTVAMVAIPQSIAYAAIAGAGPTNGLYAAIIPAMLGAFFGSSRHLVTGPTNATSLVAANVLEGASGKPEYIEYVFALAILAGLIKLALGLLGLGWITHYVSNSVLTGFLTGASTLIILGQLSSLLGLPRASGQEATVIVRDTLANISQANAYVLAAGVLTMALLILFRRINRKLPSELLAIVLSGTCVHLLGWDRAGVRLVSELGTLGNVSFIPHIPVLSVADWQGLLPSAGAVALFSLVEAMAIGNAVAISAGDRIDQSRELIGQGVASFASGLLRGIPTSGSLARTAINFGSGGRTRLSAALSGVIVLLALVALGPLMGYIPVASLAAVVIVSAFNLVNRHRLQMTWQSQTTSRALLFITLGATLLLPLHLAIYLGALLSIGIYVLESSKLQLSYLSPNPGGGFIEHDLDAIKLAPPSIVIINIEGRLSFGAADDLEQRIDDLVRSGVQVVILRLRRVHELSSTGLAALERIVAYAGRAGTTVLISGVRDEVAATLRTSGVETIIGREHIFRASEVLFASTGEALARAEDIVLSARRHGD